MNVEIIDQKLWEFCILMRSDDQTDFNSDKICSDLTAAHKV